MSNQHRIIRNALAAATGAWLGAMAVSVAASPDAHAGHAHHGMHAGHADHAEHGQHSMHAAHAGHSGYEDHSAHMAMMDRTGYQGSEQAYRVPDLMLVNQAGERVSARSVLDAEDGPVMVNFIFTTCTTICPVMSATFAQVQESLGSEADKVRMVSVSIDPEHDTPERLREYAKRFDAGPQWHFLTGRLDDSIAVQKAFGVYRGNKMNHEPTTLLKAADGETWFRMDGLASAADVVAEYRRLSAR